MTLFVSRRLALLRAVNVGGRKVPMAGLRALAGELGLGEPTTFIASGNLLFDADDDAGALEERIEAALATRFGIDVPTLVRDGADWSSLLTANPFPEAAAGRPNLLMVGLSKRPLAADAVRLLRERAGVGERVEAAGGALWFDYGERSAASRLTPSFIDRAAGSPVTTRNWRTATKLGELMGHAP